MNFPRNLSVVQAFSSRHPRVDAQSAFDSASSAILFFFMGLTAPRRRTYSASGNFFAAFPRSNFLAERPRPAATFEDRSDEMAKGTFGERLKRERELREVPLNEIAAATRISPKFLEALENEQWEKLPGGVFGHGFVRTIARYLGLSEEDLLSEYDMARSESSIASQQKPEQRIPSPPKSIPVARVLLLILLLAGIFVAGRYAWQAFQKHRAAKKPTANVILPAQDSSAAV